MLSFRSLHFPNRQVATRGGPEHWKKQFFPPLKIILRHYQALLGDDGGQ